MTPPAFRFDVAIEEDLIEEVGRMFGYDAIPATPGAAVERLGLASERVVETDRVADLLVGARLHGGRSPTASSTRRWRRS